MDRAKKMARKDFGVELVELRAKLKAGDDVVVNGTQAQANGKGKKKVANGDANGEEDELDETPRPAKKAKGLLRCRRELLKLTYITVTGSKTYALRSILNRTLIEAMCDPDPLSQLDAGVDEETEGQDHLEEEDHPDSGALMRWEKGDGGASGSMGLLGIRTLVLCMILTLGRVVSDGEHGTVSSRPVLWSPISPSIATAIFDEKSFHADVLHCARSSTLPFAPPGSLPRDCAHLPLFR